MHSRKFVVNAVLDNGDAVHRQSNYPSSRPLLLR